MEGGGEVCVAGLEVFWIVGRGREEDVGGFDVCVDDTRGAVQELESGGEVVGETREVQDEFLVAAEFGHLAHAVGEVVQGAGLQCGED